LSRFVGDDRRAIVAQLTEAFDTCIASSRTKVVCLAAEAGHGKTRVVQELYSVLQRERQPEGAYWPETFASAVRDPMRNRKLIFPEDPTPHPEAPLPWLWWGLRCDKDSSGRRVRALFNDRIQLSAHLNGLIEAAERRKMDRELALETTGEILGAVPGIGEVISATHAVATLGPKLWGRLQTGLARGRARNDSEVESRTVTTSGTETRRESEPELEFIRRFVSPELPLILVVDDAHDADPVTVGFIRDMLNLEVPVLVVATVWPSALDEQRDEEKAIPVGERVSFGGLFDEIMTATPDRLTRIDLHPLSDEALRTLVEERAPATEADRTQALLEVSSGNPLVLQLQLTSGKVSRSIASGAITLSSRELRQLPRSYERLIADRFMELDTAEQRWLAEAASQGAVFFPQLFTEGRVCVDTDKLARFVRLQSDGPMTVGRFVEIPVHSGVSSVVGDEFTSDERDAWSLGFLRALGRWWESEAALPEDPATRASLCERFVRLASSRHAEQAPPEPRAVADAAIAWSFAERDVGHYDLAVHAAHTATTWALRADDGDPAHQVRALTRLAAALSAANQLEDAVGRAAEAAALLDAWPQAPIDQLSDTLWVQSRALLCDGQIDAARRVAERSRAATAGSPLIHITALRLLASIEDAADNDAGEASALEAAVAIARAQDPVDMELVVDLESDLLNVALLGARANRWTEISQLAEQELGAGHWLHLYCLDSLATALFMEGRHDEAVAVIADLDRMQGPTGRETSQTSRHLKGFLRGDLASLSAWVAEMREVLAGPHASRADIEMVSLVDDVAALLLGETVAGEEGASSDGRWSRAGTTGRAWTGRSWSRSRQTPSQRSSSHKRRYTRTQQSSCVTCARSQWTTTCR
jgi:hypothetical protein